MKKKILSRFLLIQIIIVSCFFLVSCENKQDQLNNSYQESQINLPEEVEYISDFLIQDDGVIRIAGASNNTRNGSVWESKDSGENWEKKYSYTEAIGIDQNADVECFAYLSSSGETICVVCQLDENQDSGYIGKCYIVDNTGNYEEIINHFPDPAVSSDFNTGNEFSYIQTILSEDNLLLGNKSGEIYLADKSTFDLIDPVFEQGDALLGEDSFMVDDNKLFAIGLNSTIEYDVENRTVTKDKNTDLEAVGNEYKKSPAIPKLCAKDNAFYIVNETGIKCYIDGSEKKLVEPGEMSVMSETDYLKKIVIADEKHIFLAVNKEGDDSALFLYSEEKDKNESRVQLETYVLRDNENVKKLIEAYQKENPAVEISITVGIEEEAAGNVDDAVKKLNTEILGGEGPDVIFFDGMDVDNYIDNNLLTQLDEDIYELNNKENFDSIIKNYTKDEKIYAVPLRFYLPVVLSNNQDVIAADNNTTFANSMIENKLKLNPYSMENIGLYMYQMFLDINVDQERKETKKEIKNYLQQIKRLYKFSSDDAVSYMSHSAFPPQGTGGLFNVLTEVSDADVDYITNAQTLQYLKCLGAYDYSIAKKDGDLYYIPMLTIGINASTNSKAECDEFVRYLVSDKGQKISGETMGLSISRKVLENQINELSDEDAYIEANDVSKKLLLKKLTETETKEFVNNFENIKHAANTNSIIESIVVDYTEKYINDEITLDDAVNNIMKKINLYNQE